MTSEGDTRGFSKLILDALRDPETVDKSALLTAASAVLDTFKDGDDDRAPFLRALAFKTMDWSVFQTGEYYAELKASARAFELACDTVRMAK